MGQYRRGRAATLLLFTAIVAPAGAGAETLADAMAAAVLTSPELTQSRAQVKVLAERAVQARSQGRIQVEGSINLTTQFLELERFDYPTTMQLDVVQPLYTGGQVENATEAALTRMSAQEALVIATEQQVLLSAVFAYMDVLRDETLVDLSENNVTLISEQLRAAEERFDVGEVTRTDVAQAEARLAAARSLLAARIGALQASIEVYRRAVGAYPEDLQPPPPIPDLPASADQAVQIAMVEDPELLAARLDRIAAGSDVREAIGALLPQVALVGRVSRADDLDITRDGTTGATVGLQVTIPFYDGGFSYSRIREAQAVVEAEESDIVATMRQTAEQVGTAWADLNVAKASIEAGQLEVRAAEIAFQGVQEEAKVGARTTLDVLDAEQELLNARADLVVSRRDLVVAAYSLLFAIGKLSVEHLGLDLGEVMPVADYWDSVEDRNFGYDATDDTVWTLSYRP
jgi:outer membrane protein